MGAGATLGSLTEALARCLPFLRTTCVMPSKWSVSAMIPLLRRGPLWGSISAQAPRAQRVCGITPVVRWHVSRQREWRRLQGGATDRALGCGVLVWNRIDL